MKQQVAQTLLHLYQQRNLLLNKNSIIWSLFFHLNLRFVFIYLRNYVQRNPTSTPNFKKLSLLFYHIIFLFNKTFCKMSCIASNLMQKKSKIIKKWDIKPKYRFLEASRKSWYHRYEKYILKQKSKTAIDIYCTENSAISECTK